MRSRNPAALALTLTTVLLVACDTSRSTAEAKSATTGCIGCHGGTDNDTGAPPTDTHGRTTGPQVGAHTRHLQAGVACESCHRVPTSASDPGHIGGEKIVFGGVAKQGGATPTFVASPGNQAGGTCSATYCHGSTLGAGGTLHAPTWNGGADQAACGSCHDAIPPAPHPQRDDAGAPITAITQCAQCHPGTIDASGAIKLQGGLHVNGVVDTGVHGAGWVAAAGAIQPHGLAANFHDPAWPDGIASCRGCHGQDLDGPTAATSCNACHAANGQAGWQTSCTFCHGDAGRTAFQAAPPVNTRGQTLATDRGVGTHQVHLFGGTISDGVACADCHEGQPYADIAHVNGTVAVSPKIPGTTTAMGTFDSAAGTCASTYCHGNFRNGKTANVPSWTAPGSQGACDRCHAPQTGADPSAYTGAHQFHLSALGAGPTCSICHLPGYNISSSPPTVNEAAHVNGTVDLNANVAWSATEHTCSGSCHATSKSPAWY